MLFCAELHALSKALHAHVWGCHARLPASQAEDGSYWRASSLHRQPGLCM